MFPSPAPRGSPGDEDFDEASDGLIAYVPYSDGFGFGSRPRTAEERARRRRESAASLSRVVGRLRAAGRPVTCVVSAMLLPAADVAAEHGVPLAVFWNQSAAALAAYYHCFHGYDDERVVAAEPAREVCLLPGLPALRVLRDQPSFIVDATGGDRDKAGAVDTMRALMEVVGREKPTVLVNTLDALEVEAAALQAMRQHLDVVAVGAVAVPVVPRCRRQPADAAGGEDRIHLYERDQKGYTEWLDARPGRSVVYISFGSMLGYHRPQVEEMLRGLRVCGRPYLWVVPKDGRDEEVERCLMDNGGGGGSSEEQGMVLEWCDQIEVLSHPSTGCFVTHCRWNSTLEAVAAGVPVVAVPNWSDQPLNARLVEEWGVGVRAERDAATGLLVAAELASCVEAVMGGGDEARSIHERVSALKDQVMRREVVESRRVEAGLQNFIAANRK